MEMGMLMAMVMLVLVLVLRLTGATVLQVENKCEETVWLGVLPALAEGGFPLIPEESKTLYPPANWSGRLWGRTGCNFDGSGNGFCETGSCGNRLQCDGAGGEPPVTLVELTLRDAKDFYDVSMVDGYNLPVSMAPTKGTGTGGNCSSAGQCNGDLRQSCPAELAVKEGGGGGGGGKGKGRVVACRSACDTFNSSEYCCTGAHATPDTCPPTAYSKIFKKFCPTAYSYAYDDASSIFTCTAADYTITFCPANQTTRKVQSDKAVGARKPLNTKLMFLSYIYYLLFFLTNLIY